MIPFRLLDTATEHGATLRLYQRGMEFSIRVDKAGDLMNSRMHNSEDVLAELACKPIAKRKNAHVLVGGLGMGFTLAEALSHTGRCAKVTVAELMPAVVRWNYEHLGILAGCPIEDERVHIIEGDVGKVMKNNRNSFDAIMLDVDNGPDAFTIEDNDSLYSVRGLNSAFDALKPGGVLTVWSGFPDSSFTQRMRKVGFDVKEYLVRAHKSQVGSKHTIWVGTR